MSASLLLRLFQSEYFNVHLAVSYLRTYPDSVGITYYLVHRLAQAEESEVAFYWPQICHLVITSPGESGALEGFIVQKCEDSIHLAMLTLWQMQASLSDLASNPNTASFATCRRLYNRVQHIIFSDALLESSADACQARRKLQSHRVKPALAGMGVALAAIALPQLAAFQGQVAIEEGRKQHGAEAARHNLPDYHAADVSENDSDQELLPARSQSKSISSARKLSIDTIQDLTGQLSRAVSTSSKSARSSRSAASKTPSYLPGAPLPLAEVRRFPESSNAQLSPPLSTRKSNTQRSLTKTNSAWPSTVSAKRGSHSHSMVDLPSPVRDSHTLQDPSQHNSTNGSNTSGLSGSEHFVSRLKCTEGLDSPKSGPQTGTIRSHSPALNNVSQLHNATSRFTSSTPTLHPYASSTSSLSRLSFSVQSNLSQQTISLLLRSYACRSQLDLLTSLQDISTRLVAVPRLARLSALRAELTVLNHGLPRGCCLCLGCSGQGAGSLVSTDSISSDGTERFTNLAFRSIFSRRDTANTRRAHHRVVRISPSESVVLNSADRAPFLIHVEILEDDLDFDPTRRQNAEDIRSVMAEREGKIKPRSRASNSNLPGPALREDGSPLLECDSDDTFRSPQGLAQTMTTHGTNSPLTQNIVDDDTGISEVTGQSLEQHQFQPTSPSEEEVDLVEQLYGSFSVHDTATLPLPAYHPQIHNRTVDEKAWRRAEARKSLQLQAREREVVNSPAHGNGHSISPRKALTIDEYAERMRMAAIMLAQLNASQQLPRSGTDAVTGVVGAGVGMGVNLTYGVGSVVGSMVGVGVDAVRAGLGGGRTSTSMGASTSIAPSGQGASGLSAPIDNTSAVSGLSNVSGALNPATFPTNALSPSVQSSPLVHPDVESSKKGPGASIPSGRQRLLSPQEASAIRERIMNEMMALEEERMARMKAASSADRLNAMHANSPPEATEDEAVVMRAVNKDDPSGSVLSESWTEKKSRIRKGSPYGHLLSWDVFSVIVKTGADLRQEQLAVQLIAEFGRIWSETKCPHWIRYFRILVTSESTGLMETITDAVSVHSIKKEAYARLAAADAAQAGYLPSFTLYDHFLAAYGQPDTPRFRKAQDAFMKSLASYSIITYLLQIKDRHNGNILLDKEGHLMHIDFGFMLSNSPGSLGFEMAPFKLTQDYIDILGGFESPKFVEYKTLMKRLFKDVRRHAERIIMLVELMQVDSRLPCFSNGTATVQQLRDRFQLTLSTSNLDEYIERLVVSSAGSAFTRLYDTFQRHSQGVL